MLLDEAKLIWFFNEGQTLFQRSTLGVQLDQLQASGTDSSNQRVPKPNTAEKWLYMAVDKYGTGKRKAKDIPYECPEWQMALFGEVSRRMLRVHRADPISYVILQAYFGPWGERWKNQESFGRTFAIFAATAIGVRLIREARKQPELSELRDDDILALLRRSADEDTARQFRMIAVQATELFAKAAECWRNSSE